MNDEDATENAYSVHPYWDQLIAWLAELGMDVSEDKLPVQARAASPGAGYGLFATRPIPPSTPLFTIPARALMNSLTLAPHYPSAGSKGFTCTQYVALHLMLHRPAQEGGKAEEELFGPYISVLPREFDAHPLTWLWRHEHGGGAESPESTLLGLLPPRITAKLGKMANLFEVDWNTTKAYLRDQPELLRGRTLDRKLEEDYLWGWLNVNTRCIYHRLTPSRSSPDNMTLCPILDFANHTTRAPYTTPKPTNAEIWNTGSSLSPALSLPSLSLGQGQGKGKGKSSSKKRYGDNFVLLAPSMAETKAGEELFLRYGAHSNSTLFSEYGFVNMPNAKIQTELGEEEEEEVDNGEREEDGNGDGDDYFDSQIEVDGAVERLFKRRGEVGKWMKETLEAEGYWGDWTLHLRPAPAHPSYRLITTLRLYHLLPDSAAKVPNEIEKLLDTWRDTTLGRRPNISVENEQRWRETLEWVCRGVVTEAEEGLARIRVCTDFPQGVPAEVGGEWMKRCVEALWQEEIDVARGVIRSLENNEEF